MTTPKLWTNGLGPWGPQHPLYQIQAIMFDPWQCQTPRLDTKPCFESLEHPFGSQWFASHASTSRVINKIPKTSGSRYWNTCFHYHQRRNSQLQNLQTWHGGSVGSFSCQDWWSLEKLLIYLQEYMLKFHLNMKQLDETFVCLSGHNPNLPVAKGR